MFVDGKPHGLGFVRVNSAKQGVLSFIGTWKQGVRNDLGVSFNEKDECLSFGSFSQQEGPHW